MKTERAGVCVATSTLEIGIDIGDVDAVVLHRAYVEALEHSGAAVVLLPPVHDEATAQALHALVAKGAMPPLVLAVDDCRAAHARLQALGVEFTQEPVERYGTVDAGFRDPSGNGWKLIGTRRH